MQPYYLHLQPDWESTPSGEACWVDVSRRQVEWVEETQSARATTSTSTHLELSLSDQLPHEFSTHNTDTKEHVNVLVSRRSEDGNSVALSADVKADGAAETCTIGTDFQAPTDCIDLSSHTSQLHALALSKDERFSAIGGNNGFAAIFDAMTPSHGSDAASTEPHLRPLKGHLLDISSLSFFPSSKVLLSGSLDFTLRVWSAENGTCAATLKGHRGGISDLAILGRGRNVLSCANDGYMHLWNVGDQSVVASWAEGDALQCMTVLSDSGYLIASENDAQKDASEAETEGKVAFVGTSRGEAVGIDIRSREKILRLPGTDSIASIASGNQHLIFTGSENGILSAWDLRHASSPVQCVSRSAASIHSITPSDGDGMVWTAHGDGSVCNWNRSLYNPEDKQGGIRKTLTGPVYEAIRDVSVGLRTNRIWTASRDAKSDAVTEKDGRYAARKADLVSSKLLRGLFGDATMEHFEKSKSEYIPVELFTTVLARTYAGNTEDRLHYLFSMYSIAFGSERNGEPAISKTNYTALLQYAKQFNNVPKKLYDAFDEQSSKEDDLLTYTDFVIWVHQYSVAMNFIVSKFPPSPAPSSPRYQNRRNSTGSDVDPFKNSPSFREGKDAMSQSAFASFEFLGGEDSGEDSDDLYDSDEISAPGDSPIHAVEGQEARARRSSSLDSQTGEHADANKSTSVFPQDPSKMKDKGRRTSGVQKVGKNIGKAVGKVGSAGRHLLHSSAPPVQHPTTSSQLLAAGFLFSNESQANRDYVCGYLHKVSDGKFSKRSWNRRWFVLDRQRGMLSYYRHNPAEHISRTPRGNIVHMDDVNSPDKMKTQPTGQVERENSSSSDDDPDVQSHEMSEKKEAKATTEEMRRKSHGLLYVNTSHHWFRDEMDLNQKSVSLLFEKSLARNAPTDFFFQVSTLSLKDFDSKRGVKYKLCAENEHDFNLWTTAIAEAINRKHLDSGEATPAVPHQQLFKEQLQKKREERMHEVPISRVPSSSASEDDKESRPTLERRPSITFYSSSVSPTARFRLHFTLDGPQQCFIAGFLVNAIAVQFFDDQTILSKLFVCLVVTAAFVFAVYHPPGWTDTAVCKCCTCQKKSSAVGAANPSAADCVDPSSCCLHRKEEEKEDPVAIGLDVAKFTMKSSMDQTESTKDGRKSGVQHAWSNAEGTTFHVRSLDYKKSRKKQKSSEALFEFLGADIFKTSRKVDLLSQRMELPVELQQSRLFIINAQLPSYGPSMWSDSDSDGEGYSIMLYWRIPEDICAELEDPKTPELKLFKKFVHAGKDTSLTDRFKVIAQVTNQDECGLSGMSKRLLTSHNATPVLTRPQHRIYHVEGETGQKTTEVVVDVHQFSYIARRGIHLMLDKCPQLVVDVSFVLQGECEDELPERILGCCRLDAVDFHKAKELPQTNT